MSDSEILVDFEAGRIQKSPGRFVLVRLLRLRGRPVADLRLFVVRGEGEFVPTRMGLSVPTDKLPELRDLVDRLIEATDQGKRR